MSKKKYIVLSDNGDGNCQHHEFDELDCAKEYAIKSGENTSMKIEFAIYQKIAVTKTIPANTELKEFLLNVSERTDNGKK